jgi:hypothetical protein
MLRGVLANLTHSDDVDAEKLAIGSFHLGAHGHPIADLRFYQRFVASFALEVGDNFNV